MCVALLFVIEKLKKLVWDISRNKSKVIEAEVGEEMLDFIEVAMVEEVYTKYPKGNPSW